MKQATRRTDRLTDQAIVQMIWFQSVQKTEVHTEICIQIGMVEKSLHFKFDLCKKKSTVLSKFDNLDFNQVFFFFFENWSKFIHKGQAYLVYSVYFDLVYL